MKKLLAILSLIFFSQFPSMGQIEKGSLYINPQSGRDDNSGEKGSPLQSLYEAGRRINVAKGNGAMTIFLSKGIYALDTTVRFQPENWKFTKDARLTIRAEILPDDPNWDHGKMPVFISTMAFNNIPDDKLGGASNGIQIETSHVTIQGLRMLGSPVHERPEEGMVIRNYPIIREGRDLDDLRVTQCLFLGDIHAAPNHLPVLASGQGVVVDHCVFYGVKDAVVFWHSDRPSERSEMHHNLIVNIYGAAVWSWSLAEDFKYYNNVVTQAEAFWILNKDEKNSFNLENSLVVGYNHLVNNGGGPANLGETSDPTKLKSGKNVIIQREGSLEIVKDPTSKYYLHLKPGSLGSELGAGLFYKK
ncbi:hypothetical protein [Rhodonellum sp.]|uniref:hypothetical protein n=1 Tax=Rhodonellum sp. TaxID=2231180 RepID=UPI002724499B|nr:hypothetical protein [Rhodonellum sp.]MDO9553870.1 hypothetical protein [Rhodonellum sp.]